MDPLRRLPVLGLEALLTELDGVDGAPALTLLLRSGRELHGHLLRFDRKEGLLFRGKGQEITYLHLPALEGITVHHTAETLAMLSHGKLPAPRAPAPTRLDLKRKLLELAQRQGWKATLDFEAYPSDDTCMAILDDLVVDLGALLQRLSLDEEGRAALASLTELQIRPGPDGPRIVRMESSLEILTGSLEGLPTRLASEELTRAVERVL